MQALFTIKLYFTYWREEKEGHTGGEEKRKNILEGKRKGRY
jgi:hypothetical protein